MAKVGGQFALVKGIVQANILIGLLLAGLSAVPERSTATGLILSVLFLFVLIGLGYHADLTDQQRRLTYLLPLAFILRSGVAIFGTFVSITPELYILDSVGYDQLGKAVAEAWQGGLTVDPELFISLNVKVYALVCGAVYYLVGHSLLTMKILNCFFGALLIYNVFRIARILGGEKAAVTGTVILALFPSLIFWSSQNFRDPLVFYGVSEFVYGSIQWRATGRRRFLLRIALALIITTLLRTTVGAAAIAALFLAGFFRWARRSIPPLLRPVMYIFLVGAAGVGIYLLEDTGFSGPHGPISPSELSQMRERLTQHGATNFPIVRYETWMHLIFMIPYVTTYYLLAPLPWHLANPVQAMASIENLFVVAFLVLGILGATRLWRNRRDEAASMLLFIVITIVSAALVEGNIGTGYRHKMQFIPYIVILACGELQRRQAHIERSAGSGSIKMIAAES